MSYKPTRLSTAALAVALLLAAGLAMASNVGFKITYELLGPADSASGTNWLALPYKLGPNLETASDLFDALGGSAAVTSIARLDPLTDALEVYAGGTENDFGLVPGEGVVVVMKNTVDHRISGSHDPSLVVTFLGPESSANGTSQYAHPYHAAATTASELIDEIGRDSVTKISRFSRSTDGLVTYTHGGVNADFDLVPGESYRVHVTRTVYFLPKTRY